MRLIISFVERNAVNGSDYAFVEHYQCSLSSELHPKLKQFYRYILKSALNVVRALAVLALHMMISRQPLKGSRWQLWDRMITNSRLW